MITLPDFQEIRNYEKIASKEGSGIRRNDLHGKWRFKYVWKNGKYEKDNISSSILQVLSANLELSQLNVEEEESNFQIKNSIKLGLVSIVFEGEAFFIGKRPLLEFYFNFFYFKFAGINIITKKLNNTNEKNNPFFSLIAVDKNKKWMCARGKGGGLALWLKDI